jgi:predicted AlkP superfamily pyrophosphatase or phosphodiesterase
MLVYILLDACRFDYIDDQQAPFLAHLQKQGVTAAVQPTFGFEPDAAYLAGLSPSQSRGGAHYYWGTKDNPFARLHRLPDWLEKGPYWSSKILRHGLTRMVRRFSARPDACMARIPFRSLPYFTQARSIPVDAEYAFIASSLFDIMRTHRKTWFINIHPAHSVRVDDVIRRARSELQKPCDLLFLHIGDLDAAGHRFGPDSPERRATLLRIDRALASLHQELSARFGEPNMLILGDHGMVQVTKHLSITDTLAHMPLVQDQDYHCFLDSTMARFWFKSSASRSILLHRLAGVPHGHVLSELECLKYGLATGKNDFAEALFLADPGVLILPNYFQGRYPVQGMHGYAPECPQQQGIFIMRSATHSLQRLDSIIDMRMVFPLTLELLGLKQTNESKLLEAKPILEKYDIYHTA